MAIRGWFKFEDDIHHYVLKDRSFLCNYTSRYNGYKRDLFWYDPRDKIMSATKNWCPECLKLLDDDKAIEKMRAEGVSETPKVRTIENSDLINELNNTKRQEVDKLVNRISAIHPANVPFIEVKDDVAPIELGTRDIASELFDILNGKSNYGKND